MKQKRILDMTDHGPIRDIDRLGYMDFEMNFKRVLHRLFTAHKTLQNRQKVRILNSFVVGTDEYPERSVSAQVLTFGYLCRLYKKYYGEDFDPEKQRETSFWEMDYMDKKAEGRAAWGQYSNYKRQEQIEADSLSKDGKPIKKDTHTFQRGQSMYIG